VTLKKLEEVTMSVIHKEQNYLESREKLISYPEHQKHIYDTRDTKERVMNIINIDGCEYETDGETCISRRRQTAGYNVTMHFSPSQSDVSPVVQRVLIDEFIKAIKRG